MTKHYIILAIISIFIGTAAAQQSELSKTLPFFKSHSATAVRPSAATALQKAKAMNSSAETTYTHRLDSIIIAIENPTNEYTPTKIKITSNYQNNKLTSITDSRQYNATSNYSLSFTSSYIYDSQNRLDSLTELSYTNAIMDNGSIYHYTYDASNRINTTTTILKTSYSSAWSSPSTTDYQYNGNNITTEITKNNQNQITASSYHFFDSYKNDTLIKVYGYINNKAQLAKKYANAYSYYNSGIISSINKKIYHFNYQDSAQALINSSADYKFNDTGNVEQTEENQYDSNTQEKVSTNRSYSHTVDLNIKTSEILGFKESGFDISSYNALTQIKTSSGTTNYTFNLYYSPLVKTNTFDINTSTSQTVKVLSGTAAGSVQLQMPVEANYSAALYNAAGSKIQTIQTNSSTIAISQLAAGIYFYSISSEKANFNGKFIVK